MLTLYGIKNCDTVKKARRWLEDHGIEYQFHDFRQDGLDKKQLSGWVEQLGWEAILNKRSTTWRWFSVVAAYMPSRKRFIAVCWNPDSAYWG